MFDLDIKILVKYMKHEELESLLDYIDEHNSNLISGLYIKPFVQTL